MLKVCGMPGWVFVSGPLALPVPSDTLFESSLVVCTLQISPLLEHLLEKCRFFSKRVRLTANIYQSNGEQSNSVLLFIPVLSFCTHQHVKFDHNF